MGSRIMHVIIADQIAKKIKLKEKAAFILGGIAPDAVSPKEVTHFYTGDVTDFTRSIDYEGFIRKYSGKEQSDYILGYYTHLIADDLWLKGFYLPWLKNRMENDANIFTLYHGDFHVLNAKLADHYGVTQDLLEDMEGLHLIPDLEEVAAAEVMEFLPYLNEDLAYCEGDLDKALTVFTFDQIIGYIETSVEKGLLYLRGCLAPEQFRCNSE